MIFGSILPHGKAGNAIILYTDTDHLHLEGDFDILYPNLVDPYDFTHLEDIRELFLQVVFLCHIIPVACRREKGISRPKPLGNSRNKGAGSDDFRYRYGE